ncbi:MAG TPA: hypothetical protein VFJ14_02680 [Nocardioidaceae bacterium]|nr:hypothetical protein [Nocardioidaceae bacterium]
MSHSTVTAAPTVPESPPARRLDRRRWRDPRLWVGLLLVAGSVVLGSRLLAAADDTVDVWVLSADVPAGQPIAAAALELDRVHFSDRATAESYLLGSEPPPEAAVAAHDLAAGEMLPRSAIGDPGASDVLHLPVVVGASGAPDDLRVGDVVDVWVVPPQSADGDTGPATRVLEQVRVVSADRGAGPLGAAATRQVLLGLDGGSDGQAASGLGELLTSVSTGSVVLIRSGP